MALISVDDVSGRSVAQATSELVKKRGLQVIFAHAFPPGTTDFSAILTKVRAANPDVLGGIPAAIEESAAIISQMNALNVNPRMVGLLGAASSDRFYASVGREAEFVYGFAPWLPELIEIRAGGLIPIAQQYPGAREFVESYRKEFPDTFVSFAPAAAYGGCQILVEAIRRAGSLEGGKLRDTILTMNYNTVFGAFRVDQDGLQIANKYVMMQWQDGKKAIVWPQELAPATPRFPTPPWNQRP